MARSQVRPLLAALAVLLWNGRASAGGRISVPAAEIPEPRTLAVDLECDGGRGLEDPTSLSLLSLDARVTGRLAAGMDLRLSQGDRLTATPRAQSLPGVMVVSDWITGSSHFAGFGLAPPLARDRSLTLAYLRANDRRRGDSLFLDLQCGGAVAAFGGVLGAR